MNSFVVALIAIAAVCTGCSAIPCLDGSWAPAGLANPVLASSGWNSACISPATNLALASHGGLLGNGLSHGNWASHAGPVSWATGPQSNLGALQQTWGQAHGPVSWTQGSELEGILNANKASIVSAGKSLHLGC